MQSILYYIHDPMCSWCWGFRPVWDRLQRQLPDNIRVEYVVGGLAPDNDQPMPAQMQNEIQNTWRNIHERLGIEFNFNFWTENIPRRSTYMACRAVLVARRHGYEKEMINAIQRAYYLRAMNTSDREVLTQLANELAGEGIAKETGCFDQELESETTEQELEKQIEFADELTNKGLPSLVLEHASGRREFIQHDYHDPTSTLNLIQEMVERAS